MPERAAFICDHIFEMTRPILLVCHERGDWQFLCGGDHSDEARPHIVGIDHLLDRDASLRAILDLPNDWEAERLAEGSSWERRPCGTENGS